MPIGELAGGLIATVLRFIGQFFAEIVFEIAIKGTGYFICRLFGRRVNPDGYLATFAGLLFWGLIGIAVFWLFEHIQEWMA